MVDIRYDGSVFRYENGNQCKDVEKIYNYLTTADLNDEKLPEALTTAHRVTKSQDKTMFFLNIIYEILIAVLSYVVMFAIYSPIALVMCLGSLFVAVRGYAQDGKYRDIIQKIEAKFEEVKRRYQENNINFEFTLQRKKKKEKEKTKSHIHEQSAERVSATNNMQQGASMDGASPLTSLGAMFKASGDHAQESTTPKTDEGMTIEELNAMKKEASSKKVKVHDGSKERIGSLGDRMKDSSILNKNTATPEEPHFKTPTLSATPSTESVVESVKEQPGASMSGLLASLQSARANKTIEDVASVEVQPATSEVSKEDEPENKQ